MTAEQYVVEKLLAAEQDIDELELTISTQASQIKVLENVLGDILTLTHERESSDGRKYFGFESVWECYEPETYNAVAVWKSRLCDETKRKTER